MERIPVKLYRVETGGLAARGSARVSGAGEDGADLAGRP
jgi:hypothetical protein